LQAVREVVKLPEIHSSLVYLSSRSEGYQSILALSLIDGDEPANLLLVHLKIIIQGRLFEKKFEPSSNLVYMYEWPRTDAYGRAVYGTVSAQGIGRSNKYIICTSDFSFVMISVNDAVLLKFS